MLPKLGIMSQHGMLCTQISAQGCRMRPKLGMRCKQVLTQGGDMWLKLSILCTHLLTSH